MLKLFEEAKLQAYRTVIYVSDKENYGVIEHWAEPTPDEEGKVYGDCEDIAMYTRRLAINLGIPKERLTLAVCMTETDNREVGINHVVLLFKDDDDQLYVADNRAFEVVKIDGLPYRNWSHQQFGKPITDLWQVYKPS